MATPIVNLMSNRGNLQEFISRFERLSGKAYRCTSVDEARSIIEKLIVERGKGKAYFSSEVLRFLGAAGGIERALLYEPKQDEDGLELLKEADIGITNADFAIAETGCLVEVANSDSTRLLSSLSRVNIVLVFAKDVLGELQELAPIVRHLLSEQDKPTVTLISGPSRTSDIEMKFVLGVHGPHEVHAIIVG
jgi:L-lactate dehydrogenase complex protein LldG